MAIVVAFLLVVLSIVVLILYINHIGQSLRVAALIDSVGDETRALVDALYGAEPDANAEPPDVVFAPVAGVVFRVDYGTLVKAASAAECTWYLCPQSGTSCQPARRCSGWRATPPASTGRRWRRRSRSAPSAR